jgi:hypothetical protein
MSAHFFFGMMFGFFLATLLLVSFVQGMNLATQMLIAPEVRVK